MKRSRYILLIFLITIFITAMAGILANLASSSLSPTTSNLVIIFGVLMVSVITVITALKDGADLNEKSSSNLLIRSRNKENVALEYRVAFLEGVIDWMLKNSNFSKNIEHVELENIRGKALNRVRQKYPDAEIEIAESGSKAESGAKYDAANIG